MRNCNSRKERRSLLIPLFYPKSMEEVAQLRSLVEDILIRLENLEGRINALESGEVGGSKSKGPEPILTCVQCSAEYRESENAEGICRYHVSRLQGAGGWTYKFTCCGKSSENYDSARSLPGCTKGKHRSKHHTDYPYPAYYFYMNELSNEAKEAWLEMDVGDHVTECVEWAEVGLSKEGKVFILLGASRNESTVYAEFTPKELKTFMKPSLVVLEKTESVGWTMKAEVQSKSFLTKAITVSIKPASSPTPLVKQVEVVYEGDTPRPGKIECLSDPNPPKPTSSFKVPDNSYEGPMLEIGEDYSKGRKNDYQSESADDLFPLQLQQVEHTETSSDSFRSPSGKWDNHFTAKIRATNTSLQSIAVTDIKGEYMSKDGKWVEVVEVKVGLQEANEWFDSTNFTFDPALTIILVVRLTLRFSNAEYEPPPSSYEGRRAHHSLPQPLHLRVTFVDQDNQSVWLRFEQGNPPLPLATRESREKGWTKKKQLEFHLFADDVDKMKRSDAAIFYSENGVLCFRPAPNNDAIQYFYLGESSLANSAYRAKKAGGGEHELTWLKKENGGSKVQTFIMVDQGSGVAYALKVVITTPTSSATGYYLLPRDDASKATLTTDPQRIAVNDEFTVSWAVPRASGQDYIGVYSCYGKSSLSREYNRKAATTGSATFKAPKVPGQYEVRYYPGWLSGTYSGLRHNQCIATTTLTVATP